VPAAHSQRLLLRQGPVETQAPCLPSPPSLPSAPAWQTWSGSPRLPGLAPARPWKQGPALHCRQSQGLSSSPCGASHPAPRQLTLPPPLHRSRWRQCGQRLRRRRAPRWERPAHPNIQQGEGRWATVTVGGEGRMVSSLEGVAVGIVRVACARVTNEVQSKGRLAQQSLLLASPQRVLPRKITQ
jgi:hypothetical protein